jgi:hypothetical protein
MSDPIRAALEKAAKAVLSDLSDRKGIGNELEQCDEDIQAEIGRTVAAKAIAAFLRALPTTDPTFFAQLHTLADAVLSAAKGDQK